MSNYEYAQATQDDLDTWECAAYETWAATQETEREIAYIAQLEAMGLSNIY